jgi:hypothetical protein
MARSGGAVNTGAATRLVYTIGLIKWVVLALIAGAVLIATVFSTSDQNPFAGVLVFVMWIYGLVSALSVYVFLGWLQQTLLMLVGIAKNTARGSDFDILTRL